MLTIAEVAKQFDVTPKTVRNWANEGLIRAARYGKMWLVHPGQKRPEDGRKTKRARK